MGIKDRTGGAPQLEAIVHKWQGQLEADDDGS